MIQSFTGQESKSCKRWEGGLRRSDPSSVEFLIIKTLICFNSSKKF